MRVRRRTVIWGIVIGVGLVLASPFILFVLWLLTSGGTGSPDEASGLKAVVETIPDPESGEGRDREYASKRFGNGEWVLGIGRDSHAILSQYLGGGTIVVKDSRGQVRCFFGHVCGPRALWGFMYEPRTLDEFYGGLVEHRILKEYRWP